MELLIMLLTIFVLAIFVGFEIITKVPPTLHTPVDLFPVVSHRSQIELVECTILRDVYFFL